MFGNAAHSRRSCEQIFRQSALEFWQFGASRLAHHADEWNESHQTVQSRRASLTVQITGVRLMKFMSVILFGHACVVHLHVCVFFFFIELWFHLHNRSSKWCADESRRAGSQQTFYGRLLKRRSKQIPGFFLSVLHNTHTTMWQEIKGKAWICRCFSPMDKQKNINILQILKKTSKRQQIVLFFYIVHGQRQKTTAFIWWKNIYI